MTASGAAVTIRSDRASAKIDPVGATLSGLWLDGDAVLAGPATVEPSAGHHGAVLAPWPNRLQHGRYVANGITHQLPINDPSYGHAIHGLVFDQPWQVASSTDSSATLVHAVEAPRGYPFHVMISITYSLENLRLRCEVTWENLGTTAAPFGIGFHPYLRPGPSPMSEWMLELPASNFLGTDAATALPTPRQSVEGTAYDFRRARALGEDRFSLAYERDSSEVSTSIRLSDSAGWTLSVETSEAFGWLQLFSGHLPTASLSRRGLGIEPQTCPPNAFVIMPDEVLLKPGARGSGFWTLEGSRPPNTG